MIEQEERWRTKAITGKGATVTYFSWERGFWSLCVCATLVWAVLTCDHGCPI